MQGDSQTGRAGGGALRGGAGGMGHGRGGGGRGGRCPGGTAALPKYSQLQSGAGACQCRAGKTVGHITDVHIVHLGRERSYRKVSAVKVNRGKTRSGFRKRETN